MKVSHKLSEKKTSDPEESKTKKPSPVAPVIETPVPPQVMDPSVIPHIERKRASTPLVKRAKKASKSSRQA